MRLAIVSKGPAVMRMRGIFARGAALAVEGDLDAGETAGFHQALGGWNSRRSRARALEPPEGT